MPDLAPLSSSEQLWEYSMYKCLNEEWGPVFAGASPRVASRASGRGFPSCLVLTGWRTALCPPGHQESTIQRWDPINGVSSMRENNEVCISVFPPQSMAGTHSVGQKKEVILIHDTFVSVCELLNKIIQILIFTNLQWPLFHRATMMKSSGNNGLGGYILASWPWVQDLWFSRG